MSARTIPMGFGFGILHSTPGGGPSRRSFPTSIAARWDGVIGIFQETLAFIMIIPLKLGLRLS